MKFLDLFLQLSTFCNHKCVFCNNRNMTDKKMVVPWEIKGIEDMLEVSRYVDITGYGEVTIHPQFSTIMAYFNERKVPVRIVSNGEALNNETIEILNRSNLHEFVISINSLVPETHHRLTGGNLHKILENVQKLKHHPKLSFSFVLNAWNMHEIKGWIEFGKHYGRHIACLGLTPIIKHIYPNDLEIPVTEQNLKWFQECRDYARQLGVSCFIYDLKHKSREQDEQELSKAIRNCQWVYDKFFISAEGIVTPCCWSKVELGNVFKEDFNSIWQGEKYNDLRDKIKKGDLAHCRSCRKDG